MSAKRPSTTTPSDETLTKRLGRLLAKRELSVREARARLLAWGADAPQAARLVKQFTTTGGLDDARAADAFCRAMLARREVSRAWLLQALADHGISPQVAQHAADAALGMRSPVEQARELAGTLAAKHPLGLALVARRRRLIGVLARRGFDEDTTLEAVNALLPEDADQPAD